MDPHLARYLEQPVPRPPLVDSRYDERQNLWLFPLGGVFFASMLVGSLVWGHPERAFYGASAWLVLVGAATAAGRWAHASYQALYRRGTFTEARVLERSVENDGEELSLNIRLEVDLPGSDQYRAPPTRSAFRMLLSDRWLEASFDKGSSFPALVADNGRTALVFVHDETLEAAAVESD